MINNLQAEKEIITIPKPETPEKPVAPEKIEKKEKPQVPNPFVVPIPQIQPGKEPTPKA